MILQETERGAVRVLREMREIGKRKKSRVKLGDVAQVSDVGLQVSGLDSLHVMKTGADGCQMHNLAPIILWIARPSTAVADGSELMQHSFRKYQWQASLSLCLAKLTDGFVLRDIDFVLRKQKELMAEATETSRIKAGPLLRCISERKMIPMTTKPHAIFFLSSEQNFVAACFDWLLWSVSKTGDMEVSRGEWGFFGALKIYNSPSLVLKTSKKCMGRYVD
jgi:hypothetical protein